MRWIALAGMMLAATGLSRAAEPVYHAPYPAPANQPIVMPAMPSHDPTSSPYGAPAIGPSMIAGPNGGGRGLFESDREFPGFIGPISNPVLSKDPRSLTELRALFVNNWFPDSNPVLGGGDAQIYGMQARLALTERLTFIADKDGYGVINARNLKRDGWLNIAAGLKYAFVRDVENQLLVTGGVMYEPRTGESDVFQNQGDGLVTAFGVIGKEFGDAHVILNGGYQFALWDSQNSSFLYSQIHVDYRLFGWLYPLVECNFFAYNSGGVVLPAGLGEGDGLINFGTNAQAGKTFVTVAVGLKAQVNCHLDVGVAWETPLGTKDIMLQRLLVEMIFRY